MKPAFAAVLAATLMALAACDRPAQPRTQPSAGSGPSAPTQPLPQTGTSGTAEKKDGSNPVQQGQVDPKQGAQHKDFQQPGDGAGPRSADTAPKQ